MSTCLPCCRRYSAQPSDEPTASPSGPRWAQMRMRLLWAMCVRSACNSCSLSKFFMALVQVLKGFERVDFGQRVGGVEDG